MWNWLLQLGTFPSRDLTLACPPPPAGQTMNATGFYDMATVHSAFDHAAFYSSLLVVAAVLLTYLATRVTLGPTFVKRWWVAFVLIAVLCGAASWAALHWAPTTALAGSCESNPDAFARALPSWLVFRRALAGLAWGAIAFALLSIILTQTVGRIAGAANGFFHNRGCPVPRFTP